MDIKIMLSALLLASISSAEALMVTVTYDSGDIGIKYAELMPGPEPTYSLDGPYLLAYETDFGTMPATSFYMPILVSNENEIRVEEMAEHTMAIPYEAGAGSLSLYSADGELLSSFDLSGISEAGDFKGSPPEESIAGRSGQASVSGAVQKAINPSAEGGGAGEGGSACASLILPALAMAGILVKR